MISFYLDSPHTRPTSIVTYFSENGGLESYKFPNFPGDIILIDYDIANQDPYYAKVICERILKTNLDLFQKRDWIEDLLCVHGDLHDEFMEEYKEELGLENIDEAV